MRSKRAEKVVQAVLNEYALVVNRINHINLGGCGLFAEYLYLTLTNLGLKPKIAIVGRNKDTIKYVLKNNGSAHDLQWSHIIVYVGGMYLDSSGIRISPSPDAVRYPDVVTGMSLDLLREWNNNPRYWNPTFDRRQKKYIEYGFKEIEKKASKKLRMSKLISIFAP
jgi:hypothetical protein